TLTGAVTVGADGELTSSGIVTGTLTNAGTTTVTDGSVADLDNAGNATVSGGVVTDLDNSGSGDLTIGTDGTVTTLS
ncbi:hypothetical protein, partial [Tritonibacter mobilis]